MFDLVPWVFYFILVTLFFLKKNFLAYFKVEMSIPSRSIETNYRHNGLANGWHYLRVYNASSRTVKVYVENFSKHTLPTTL